MATKVTSASPIISAAAVEAVRLGFRVAFSRASAPAGPPTLRAGPAEHLRERPDEPRRVQRRAEEEQQDAERRARAAAARSRRRGRRRRRGAAGSPSTSTTTAVIGPKRASRDGGRTEPSRTAAIGGTRVARIAGRRLASSVITTPTRRLTITVRVEKTSPACGRSIPIVPNERVEQLREPEPEREADDRADQADHQRLDEHRAAAPGAASRRSCAAWPARGRAARS